jgi:hypothetical protein
MRIITPIQLDKSHGASLEFMSGGQARSIGDSCVTTFHMIGVEQGHVVFPSSLNVANKIIEN